MPLFQVSQVRGHPVNIKRYCLVPQRLRAFVIRRRRQFHPVCFLLVFNLLFLYSPLLCFPYRACHYNSKYTFHLAHLTSIFQSANLKKPPSWILLKGMFCAKFTSVRLPSLVNNCSHAIASGRFSVQQFWPWTLTLTSQLSNSDIWCRCQISWKSDFCFLRNHFHQAMLTNKLTKLTNTTDHNTTWRK